MPYHVIEFEELPYADIDKYICVPESWIKWQDKSKGKVIVAYPVEEPSCTQRRVENDAKYSRDWKCFLAKEEYNTNDSEEAVPGPKHKPGRPSDRNRGKAKITLPPEYDPDFPRWSLKYPESSYRERMDLIEIRPGGKKSGIYVNRRGFDKCFEISDTDNALARNLLKEIFTKNALRVCTLTGKVPAGFQGDQSEIRPGLYVHGVTALVETVLKHGFGESEESVIRSCLSAKLNHLRKTL